MSLFSNKIYTSDYSLFLRNKRFVECDPQAFNVIIPLSGDYYYSRKQI